ncbi:Alpha/beta hydrolase family protein [Roseovarius sp. THAF9]|uniref:alpha/beta hydrolase n=1 Tax=Roseovarius sp. THAF9 TaxID=2587847 RepID=UPI0012679B67|nr:alpha/beta hydrolase [Roseovarius sp. THAF9]QFT93490.1 Alpha/beta hydrolase family protein [Roseovarius sp. THAF9]
MPLLQIDATPLGPRLHDAAQPLLSTLRRALVRPGPVIIMTHGFKFEPGHPNACPHTHILSLAPKSGTWKAKSWPRGLGFGAGNRDEGLAIGFGWSARGSIWDAYKQAEQAGFCLADLVSMIRRVAPDRPVHLMAHSMGARVALGALPRLRAGAIGRVLLLNGAEFGTAARAAIESDAGRAAEIISVTTRENDLFDFLMERLISAPEHGDRSLAQALPQRQNTLTVQLDHPDTLPSLERTGFRVAPGRARFYCHWSTYLREGLFDFYRALLREPQHVTLSRLRAQLPDMPDPRWSRVLPWPKPGMATLPFFSRQPQARLSSGGITSSTMNQ